jgi:hypothetical protein
MATLPVLTLTSATPTGTPVLGNATTLTAGMPIHARLQDLCHDSDTGLALRIGPLSSASLTSLGSTPFRAPAAAADLAGDPKRRRSLSINLGMPG